MQFFIQNAHIASRLPENPFRIDAKRGDHFLQAFPLPIGLSREARIWVARPNHHKAQREYPLWSTIRNARRSSNSSIAG
jgi:hypothetical protein